MPLKLRFSYAPGGSIRVDAFYRSAEGSNRPRLLRTIDADDPNRDAILAAMAAAVGGNVEDRRDDPGFVAGGKSDRWIARPARPEERS